MLGFGGLLGPVTSLKERDLVLNDLLQIGASQAASDCIVVRGRMLGRSGLLLRSRISLGLDVA